MKKYLLILLCFFALPITASAAVCSTKTVTANDYEDFNATTREFLAIPFSVTSPCDVGSVEVDNLYQSSTPAGSISIGIYDDNGSGSPTFVQEGSNGTNLNPSATAVGGSDTSDFTSSGVSLEAGHNYWVIMEDTDAGDQAASAYNLGVQDGATPHVYESDAGGGAGNWGSTGTGAGLTVNDGGGGGGGGGGDSSATSTASMDQSEENLFNGFMVFMVSFFGMVWLLRKH